MENLLYFYIIFSYLFELGASSIKNGSNWWNFLLAPIILPIKMGMYYAHMISKN
jgi:hypothetical protein